MLAAVAPAAQVPLELPGDGVAAGLRQVRRVLCLLQRLDVLGDLRVLLGQLVYPAFPGSRLVRQVSQRQGDVEYVLDPAEQRQRCLRAGRLRHVMRHRGPQRDRRYARRRAGMLQPADDPRRPLVVHRLDVQLGGELGIGGGRGHRHRAGMRGVREQRAEQDHQLHAEVGERADQLIAEGTPAHIGLDPVHQHQIAAGALRAGQRQPGSRPDQPVGPAVGDLHHRTGHLEVVEVLRIDGADGAGLPGDAQMIDHSARCLACVIPALEGSDQGWRGELGWRIGPGWRGELADAVELDLPPPSPGFSRPCPGFPVAAPGFPGAARSSWSRLRAQP